MKLTQKEKNELNKGLTLLCRNRHFKFLPIREIEFILDSKGLKGNTEGIYCGREGRVTELVAENSNLVFSWYQMESGRYEVLAYIS